MNLHKLKSFGFKALFWKFLFNYRSKYKLEFLQRFVVRQKHKAVKEALLNMLELNFDNYKTFSTAKPSNKVWYFWWDGVENMPAICNKCLESVKENVGEKNVNIIDKTNFTEFVSLSPTIKSKFEAGSIPIQQFSDILRVELLKKHGGLWLDATILLASDLTNEMFGKLYTVKHGQTSEFVSNGAWSVFCIGGRQNHPLFEFLSDSLNQYFEKYDSLIDYFLMDYLISLAYENIPCVKQDINALPVNNPDIYFLERNRATEYNEFTFKNVVQNTKLFKLNWRSNTNNLREHTYLSHVLNSKLPTELANNQLQS
ncbi:capsular polysaccharide synthesis protein [Glaciecola sp. 2405UD65-10]|uniref:capsular polysaccharide synthesis protein n=1 Tax=Glaciecola sp. 2405UD65-10 TaxID=3397244 RepID=UPI003B5AD25D